MSNFEFKYASDYPIYSPLTIGII